MNLLIIDDAGTKTPEQQAVLSHYLPLSSGSRFSLKALCI